MAALVPLNLIEPLPLQVVVAGQGNAVARLNGLGNVEDADANASRSCEYENGEKEQIRSGFCSAQIKPSTGMNMFFSGKYNLNVSISISITFGRTVARNLDDMECICLYIFRKLSFTAYRYGRYVQSNDNI